MKKIVLPVILSIFWLVAANLAAAGDLDDGISTFTDDGIASYDDMGKPDKNIKFIILNSKSRAKVAEKAGNKGSTTTGQTTGDNNRNSVVMGAGSKILGDVIIVDESKDN
ncbi:MAG: hypothetical protein P1P81_05590 [Desulfobulbales bacterium]|nr:hypothetical protein [Desulfobulbales bacterium]